MRKKTGEESKRIETLLRKALLEEGKMEHSLYEYELEEHIDYWYNSLKADKDEFVFAITENSGHVAMVLITPEKTLYINEEARKKLSKIWSKANAYVINMNLLIPQMADDLASGNIAFQGVKTVANKSPRRMWGKLNG